MSEVALFIHSTATGPFMWTPFMAGRPEGMGAIAPVNRGYSPQDLLPRGTPFSVDEEVKHLKAQIPAGTTGVHLVAHSYGGFAALTLAQDLAQVAEVPVRSLCLIEPVLFGSLRAEEHALSAELIDQMANLYGAPNYLLNEEIGGSEEWIERFVDYWNQPGMWALMPEKAKTMTRMVGWKMFQEVRMVSTEPKAFEHYRVDVPLTLVYGEHTTAPAKEMVRRLAEVNPHAHVEMLPGQGHMAVVGAQQAVLPALAGHWARMAA
ncbi:MAG: alpha/beta hydrolase [Burkholderiales bacterium]|nr:alpha/beta hydrolase [Burkholderiales bacterium]